MAKQWQFSVWKRIVMQAVMWVLLAGTVGLAALVDRSRSHWQSAELGEAMTSGDLTFRLPVDWQASRARQEDGEQIVAGKPGDKADHVINIVRLQLGAPMFAGAFIRDELGPRREADRSVSRTVDGHAGQEVHWTGVRTLNNKTVNAEGFAWCSLLPSGEVIFVYLERTGPVDNLDQRLFGELLDAIKISPPH